MRNYTFMYYDRNALIGQSSAVCGSENEARRLAVDLARMRYSPVPDYAVLIDGRVVAHSPESPLKMA